MARLVCTLVLLEFMQFCFLARSSAPQKPGGCGNSGIIFLFVQIYIDLVSLVILISFQIYMNCNFKWSGESALENSHQGCCGLVWNLAEIPVVRNVTELGQDSYGRPGLSHMTIAGAVHHGMKEVVFQGVLSFTPIGLPCAYWCFFSYLSR